MPRPSYEQHRAAKRRRGSYAESETDAESLFSTSSHLSSTSNFTYSSTTSPREPPYPSFTRSISVSSYPAAQPPSPTSRRHLDVGAPPSSSSSRYLDVVRSERDIARARRRTERERRSTLAAERFDSPLRRWLRWMSRAGLSRYSLGTGLVGVGVVKTAVGYGGFSGKDTPPMYGDFEAQRHWMEVALHRPFGEWYTYTPEWWLLDYPPLTGYVSWLCGRLGSALDTSHFALDASRGLSPPALVTYMRFSVLTLEALVWWSAVVAWMMYDGRKGGRSWRSQMTGIMTVLLQPSLMLIDNGHFQYNSVLLGFSLFSLLLLTRGHDLLACVSFSLALCFKQMGLYYAPAIGCYLLGKCLWLGGTPGLIHFAKLGIVTASAFLVMFAAWLRPFPSALRQVIHRIFPFARGIFEDKVANFWCATNVVVKWKHWVSVAGMARLATLTTLIALMPTVIILIHSALSLRQPTTTPTISSNGTTTKSGRAESPSPPANIHLLPIALFISSLSFFLFSFQVHEKSILLPLMPLTLMMATRSGKGEDEVWDTGVLLNNVAVFSMWPLLVRDGQALQYVLTTFLWNYVIGYSPFSVQSDPLRFAGYAVYFTIALVHLPDIFQSLLPSPSRYPDLYVVLNVLLSFGVFGGAWVWGMKRLIEGAWAIGGLGGDGGGAGWGRERKKAE